VQKKTLKIKSNNFFKHPKHNHLAKLEEVKLELLNKKLKTEVIRPFIINTLQNSSDKNV